MESKRTTAEIAQLMGISMCTVNNHIRRMRKHGYEIKADRIDGKPIYQLIKRPPQKSESLLSKVRIIMNTGDEWSIAEIAEMTGRHHRSVQNAITNLRREGMVINKVWLGDWFYKKVQDEKES